MPKEGEGLRRAIKAKHRKSWQEQIREECFRRVHCQRDLLLQQRRGQPLKDALDSVLSAVASQVPQNPDGEPPERDASAEPGVPLGSKGKPAERTEFLRHEILSRDEHQELMAQMEALLFDEGYRDELAAIEADETEDISDLLARHTIEDVLPDGDFIEVLCPVCEKAPLVESVYGYIRCPVDQYTIEAPMQGMTSLLSWAQENIRAKTEEHHESGCSQKPSFFVKHTGTANLYIACYDCGVLDVVL